MEAIFSHSVPQPREGWQLSGLLRALQDCAELHSLDLAIDFQRMRRDFGALWMIARCRLRLRRPPRGPLSLQTCLRPAGSAVSLRDFALEDEAGALGSAAQSWVLVDAASRKLLPMKQIAPVVQAPSVSACRLSPGRVPVPQELADCGSHLIGPEEIDSNGHLNNVRYVAYAEAACPGPWLGLDVVYDRECFAGELLRLQQGEGGRFLRGLKPDGSESFRLRFVAEAEL